MRLIFLFIVVGFIAGCQSKPTVPAGTPVWKTFEAEFFNALWPLYPHWAAGLGLHQYDAELKAPSAMLWEERRAFLRKFLSQLEQLPLSQLTSSEAMDYELIKNFLASSQWEMDTLKIHEWNPAQYNIGGAIATVLEGKNHSEEKKLRDLSEKLSKVPAFYRGAIGMIKTPTREYTELAISQNAGLIAYLEGELRKRIEASKLSVDEKRQALSHLEGAQEAIRQYVLALTNLKKKLIAEKGFKSFRIGKDLYRQKFVYDLQASLSADQVYQKALAAKKQTHRQMLERARALWPKYFPKKAPPAQPLVLIKRLVDKIAENHIRPDEFLPTIQKQVPELWKFVEKKDLLTLDPKKPLKVRATPLYERGFAGASVDAPGPFDPYRETFYNVTPLDAMTPARQESYLREYNNYTLQILNIHEAIPGHYAQLVYSNQSPSLVKQIFGSGTMVEGWAVYAETMMLEEGYGDGQPELWLMYDKWRLRVICNTILDYSVHNLNMTRGQALKLLKDEAFQETTEAEEKWNRATYSQVQLASYFTGFTEIYEFRERRKKSLGEGFDLKQFHEAFLSYGSSPIKNIVQAMEKK